MFYGRNLAKLAFFKKSLRLIPSIFIVTQLFSTNLAIAKIAAGGIEFSKPRSISVLRQDLSLSPDKVSVSYLYKNESSVTRIETLSFSLPTHEQNSNEDIDARELVHNFEISVDGHPIQYQTQVRAFNKFGVDITGLLKTLQLPLNPKLATKVISENPLLGREIRDKLFSSGLLDPRSKNVSWHTKKIYSWQQRFPATKTVFVKQSYQPGVKRTNGDIIKYANDNQIKHTWFKKFKAYREEGDIPDDNLTLVTDTGTPYDDICLNNKDFNNSINFIRSRTKPDTKLKVRQLDYLLTKDANWAGPIKKFTLRVEHPQNMVPVICWPLGLKRVGPTTLISQVENFVPLHDLTLMLVERDY